MPKEVSGLFCMALSDYLQTHYAQYVDIAKVLERLHRKDGSAFWVRNLETGLLEPVGPDHFRTTDYWYSNHFMISLYDEVTALGLDPDLGYKVGLRAVEIQPGMKTTLGVPLLGAFGTLRSLSREGRKFTNTKEFIYLKSGPGFIKMRLKHYPGYVMNDFALSVHQGVMEGYLRLAGCTNIRSSLTRAEGQGPEVYDFDLRFDKGSRFSAVFRSLLLRVPAVRELVDRAEEILEDHRKQLLNRDRIIEEKTRELTEANQELMAAREAMRMLNIGVAHNFNNMLMAMGSNTEAALELLGQNNLDRNRLRALMTNVVDGVTHSRGIVQRLTHYLTAGGISNDKKEVFEIQPIIETVAGLIRASLRQSDSADVAIRSSLQTGLSVEGNFSQLMEVVLNLATNAVEAMPQGGVLNLTASREGDQAVIRVADNGKGMTAEVLGKAFDPFFSTKSNPDSRGFGLGSSRGMVRRMGGDVIIHSKPTVGTTVQVRLKACDAPDPPRPKARPCEKGNTPLDIVLVEDEVLVAMGISALLEKEGHSVRKAARVGDALAELEAGRPDLVLCDLGLPDGSGWKVAQAALALDEPPAVVMLTGWSHQQVEPTLPAELAGKVLVIHKPVDRDALLEAVAKSQEGA